MSLSSGETVPTKWRPCQDEIMTRKEATVKKERETNPKQTESTAADECKHKQGCWKQFVETHSTTSEVYGQQS